MVLLDLVSHEADVRLLAVVTFVLEGVDRHALIGFADALDVVKKSVDYVTTCRGGHGAVREICDLILQGQGRWPDIAAKYEFSEHL